MGMNLRRATLGLVVLLGFGTFGVHVHAADLHSIMIGKFQSIMPGTGPIEFMKNGTVIIGQDVGDYSWLDEERIRINLAPPNPARVCTVLAEYGVLSLI